MNKKTKKQVALLLVFSLVMANFGANKTVFATESGGEADNFQATVSGGDAVSGGDTVSGGDIETNLDNEISVGAQSSFGNMLANEFSEEISSQQENNGYNVFSIEMEDNIAKVSFESLGLAALVVGIYDEAGTEMLALGSAEVSAEEKTALVEIETEEMPAYFYVRGFLVDSVTYRPLCTVYESPLYTQEMQEFLAKTTADFDADRVLNLDEDVTNNFAVFGEDTILISGSNGYNNIASIDNENNRYVIENADSSVMSLQLGDIFSYRYSEDEVLIIKVDSISIDGTTATIVGAETSMEEVFDYVKIDAWAGSGDALVDDSTCAEGVTYEGLVDYVEEDAPQTYADIEGSKSEAFKLKLNKEFGSIEDLKVKVSGGLEVKVTFSAKVYFTLSTQYVELKLDYSSKLSLDITGQAKAEIPLMTVGFMFTGVIVELNPSIIIDAKATISLSGTLSGCIGFRAEVGKGITSLNTVPEFKPSLKVEGSVFVGFSLEPRVKILSDKVASAGLKGRVGVEVSASMKDPLKDEDDKQHTCMACIDGEVNGKFSITASLKLVNKWNFELTLLDKKFKILDFYYSLDKDEFGLTTCPYYLYRVKIAVVNPLDLFSPVNGVEIRTASSATMGGRDGDDDEVYVTDEEGQTEFWIPAGGYYFTFSKKGYKSYTLTAEVKDKGINLTEWMTRKDGESGGSGSGGSGGSQEGATRGVKEVSLGDAHSAAITENGDLYLWGYNGDGQLGNGTNDDSNIPIKIMSNVKKVSLGDAHSAAITEEGDLYLWGYNGDGQLGNGTNDDSNIPIKIMSSVKEVSLGKEHSAAITEEGDLYLWGFKYYNGQSWNGVDGWRVYSNIPIKIMSSVKEVSLGDWHSAAITEEGDLYLSGYNREGQLGNGTNDDSKIPIKIMSNVKEVSLGDWHSAAITEEGDLYLWGWNYYGQLGNGTDGWGGDSNIPIKIMSNVKEVGLGDRHSAAITKEGDLYLWGWEYYGELGKGTDGWCADNKIPIKIMSNVKEVSLGEMYSAAITEEGDLYLWGKNDRGQLGNGTIDNSNVPVKITIPNNHEEYDDIAAMQLIADYNESMGTLKNWNGSNFSDLLSNEVYNYYIMKDSNADAPFASSNLIYIGQALSDENGNLNVDFTEKEEYADAEIFAVPMHLADLSGAEVNVSDLTCNGKVQYAPITVAYQGTALVPGEDFYVEGEYGVTQEGEYTLKVIGTGLYSGEVTASYRVNPGEQTFGISGSISSFGDTGDSITVRLLKGTNEAARQETASGTYTFDDITSGTYTLEVVKTNHVTRQYPLEVINKDLTQDVEICLIGDINGDGSVNVLDNKVLYNHIEGISVLNGYNLAVADVNGDGSVNVLDNKVLYNHIEGISLLW